MGCVRPALKEKQGVQNYTQKMYFNFFLNQKTPKKIENLKKNYLNFEILKATERSQGSCQRP